MPENFQNEYQQDELKEDNTSQIISKNTPLRHSQEGMSVQPDSLGKGQKIAAIFLGFFAIFVLVFWGIQFKKGITDPLAYKGDNTEGNSSSYQEDTEESWKNKDTDKDGLSDWEELNIYLTSPYLDDSDSDGYKDKEEIDNGNDPICPVGRDCYGPTVSDLEKDSVPEEENSEEISQELLDFINSYTNDTKFDSESLNQTGTKELEDLLSGNSSIDDVRKILLEYGIDQDTLNQISDEDLMNQYKRILEES